MKIEFPNLPNNVANKLTKNQTAEGNIDCRHKVRVKTRGEPIFDPNHLMPV